MREAEQLGAALPTAPQGITARQAHGHVVTRPETRTFYEEAIVQQLASPHSLPCCAIHSSMLTLPSSSKIGSMKPESAMPLQLMGFATTLWQHQGAKVAALSLPSSQG
jgi:hypothetical protein